MESTKWLQARLIPNGWLYMNYFLWMGFIVTLTYCVTYKDVSHFSNAEDIRIFRMN